MAEQLVAAGPVRLDTTGIEPIAEANRDSTSWQQFWLWFGANVTPTSWVVGAIGPQLGLSLVQSLIVIVVGQVAGALIFGLFTLMGKRTGVAQLTLGRATFGILGNRGPAIIQGLVSLAWVGVNTYVVLSAAKYVLHSLGVPSDNATEYGVAAVIMIIQVLIGTLGFYAIQAFEKYTVPVMCVLMAVMTVLACLKGHIVWGQVLAGEFFDAVVAIFADQFGVHQFTADGYGTGSGFEKLSGGFEIHSTGWNHLDCGNGPLRP